MARSGTYSYIFYLADYAKLVGLVGQPIRAARFYRAAEAQREAHGGLVRPVARAHMERDIAATRAQLDEATFAVAWTEGRALTLEQAIRYAREVGVGNDVEGS